MAKLRLNPNGLFFLTADEVWDLMNKFFDEIFFIEVDENGDEVFFVYNDQVPADGTEIYIDSVDFDQERGMYIGKVI